MKALALLDGTADVFLAIKEHRQTNMTPITRSTAWIYGSVSLPLAIISYPLAVWIPRLYSTEIGIDLGLIGLVIFWQHGFIPCPVFHFASACNHHFRPALCRLGHGAID